MNDTEQSSHLPRSYWLLPLLLMAGAAGLYGLTLSTGAFPGLPAKALVWHLGLDPTPTLLDSLWGRLVRLCAVLPGGSVAFWSGLLSVLFGAGCVGLASSLMMRVRYKLHDEHDPDEVARESQARLLAGLTTGLFLMVSIPFWILSTRSLPGTFHLFLLLAATGFFSEYQRTGKPTRLYAMGLIYGAGITEFATFWVFAPLAALLVVRAMLQRAEFRWPVLIRTALCLIPGLLLYPLNAWTIWSNPTTALRGFQSMWGVLWFIWRDQWHLIVHAPQTTGFLLVLALTLIPWGVLFLLRAKRPAWRYRVWPVLLRMVVLAAAIGTVVNAPLSPWNFFGMYYVMVTPYLILAVCAGYVAGEFWVMGQRRAHRNAGIGQPLRSVMGVMGLLLPVGILVAGGLNYPVANGRSGAHVDQAAAQILDDLQGRDILLSNGVMDDSVRLQAQDRGLDILVISLPQTQTKPYRDYLAGFFPKPRQQALLQVGFSPFLQDFMVADEGLLRVAALDLSDLMREFGYLEPDHLITRAEVSEADVHLDSLLEAQPPFWAWMEPWASCPEDKRNPASGYQGYLLRLASKVANNLGFMQVEAGDAAGAVGTFHQARRLDDANISALLNLLTIAQEKNLPELSEYEAEWEDFKQRHVDSRVMWSLGSLYGYVYNTGFLARNGIMWAVSGKPRRAEAELRRASGTKTVDPEVKAFLGRAYLQSGDLKRSGAFYRELLQENPEDPKALLMLAEISMNVEDYAEAEKLFDRAEKAGVSSGPLRFDRAILTYLQGDTQGALSRLQTLVKEDKENIRAWALLAILTSDGRDSDTYEKALKSLKNLKGASPDIRLMVAELHMSRKEWADARTELEQVVRMNPRQIQAWEMLVSVDFQERKREIAEDHVRALLTLDPENYTGNLMLGSFQYARAQYSLAESSYRKALESRRDPAALNDLAYLLMLKDNQMDEALALVEEALALQPENAIFLSTRGELYLREGRLDEAEADLQQVLFAMPDTPPALLLSAQLYAARGQKEAAMELATSLVDRQGELPVDQQNQLQQLLKQLE